MPSLNWIGKQAVVNHDKEVSFRLLKKVKSASVGDSSKNLIIQGDNLEALKSLMPYYYNKIDCIYIDPPYNTGNEKWIYNDKVNSPKIRQWLTKVVKFDDLTKHDKWLCMMYPRLKLLKDLLKKDGVIFVSIDDKEEGNLRALMDEIFDEKHFFAKLTWVNRSKPKNMGEARFNIQQNVEYIFVYGKVPMKKHPRFILENLEKKEYPLKNKKGNYRLEPIVQRRNIGSLRRDTMLYTLLGLKPRNGYRWQLSEKKYKELIKNKAIILKDGKPFQIFYEKEEDNFAYIPFWSHLTETGTAEDGKKELSEILGHNHGFETVKPLNLIKQALFHIAEKNDNATILDSFAGSGTTGHAVMDLNKDGGNRRFILVEMEKDVMHSVTLKRLHKVAKSENYKDDFEYCELDKPLFDEKGKIDDSCDFSQLATYVYFTETQTNIDPKKIKKNFIGSLDNIEYYLIYKGKNKNDLNKTFLQRLKKDGAKKVVYADRCLVDEDLLAEYGVIFKQIPYEVKVY
jgi:adenine-specific DNA-methyltransferase